MTSSQCLLTIRITPSQTKEFHLIDKEFYLMNNGEWLEKPFNALVSNDIVAGFSLHKNKKSYTLQVEIRDDENNWQSMMYKCELPIP
jgi:hypothetical protein